MGESKLIIIALKLAIDTLLTVTAQGVQIRAKSSISVAQASENRLSTKESLSIQSLCFLHSACLLKEIGHILGCVECRYIPLPRLLAECLLVARQRSQKYLLCLVKPSQVRVEQAQVVDRAKC